MGTFTFIFNQRIKQLIVNNGALAANVSCDVNYFEVYDLQSR